MGRGILYEDGSISPISRSTTQDEGGETLKVASFESGTSKKELVVLVVQESHLSCTVRE